LRKIGRRRAEVHVGPRATPGPAPAVSAAPVAALVVPSTGDAILPTAPIVDAGLGQRVAAAVAAQRLEGDRTQARTTGLITRGGAAIGIGNALAPRLDAAVLVLTDQRTRAVATSPARIAGITTARGNRWEAKRGVATSEQDGGQRAQQVAAGGSSSQPARQSIDPQLIHGIPPRGTRIADSIVFSPFPYYTRRQGDRA
jgi:hypothetical protein